MELLDFRIAGGFGLGGGLEDGAVEDFHAAAWFAVVRRGVDEVESKDPKLDERTSVSISRGSKGEAKETLDGKGYDGDTAG